MEPHRSNSSNYMTMGERTESFLTKLEELNTNMVAADQALKELNNDILSHWRKQEEDNAKWAATEQEWLAELEAIKEETGTSPEEADYAEKQYWTSSREWRDVMYGGCCLYTHNDNEVGSRSNGLAKPQVVEVILEQKHFKGKLFYKVKWADADVVSWEEATELKNCGALKNAINSMFSGIEKRTSRLRPALYIPSRNVSGGALGEQGSTYNGIWSCEVEPNIWIPYDNSLQLLIEKAFKSSNDSVAIRINNMEFTINFSTMKQVGGAQRRVRRTEQVPDDVLRKQIERMSLQQLREYIASVAEFTPVHYEALARLHEEDKVLTHLSRNEIAALPHMTFAQLMEEICNGAEYKAFSTECSICLEDYEGEDQLVCMPNCGHFFHKACAGNYFSRFSKLCPFCKESVA